MPLKNIPKCLSPSLLHALASMGHGDEIVLADAHFPTSALCKNGPLELRADGVDIPTLLDGILQLLPLDTYVKCPVALMDPVQSDKDSNIQIPVWDKYKEIVKQREGPNVEIEFVERFAFYDRAKTAYAIVHTGEMAKYGNIILKKGLAL
ncbi:fucose mutarotase-like [Crassostrea angulata]|uniref:fucose mutarotase-like n=1 Tax=Magallana angulata TaxID=2784310 RepID=UPI0005C3D3AC|nr:fucose mutarotase-like [Crassostrea angulata]|eukprot:XP_011448543.1 PREDICTED: fucose mutarotase-like isoform X1 [Crassostrea gigas]